MLTKTIMVAGIVVGLLSGQAVAGPIARLSADSPAADPLVVQVHGCHRDGQLGPRGWHYHGRGCQWIPAGPRAYAPPPPVYYEPPRRYYEPPRRRPVCFQDCNYIGPIKQCRTVCR